MRLRDHVLRQFERAARDPSLVDKGALTVVIAGGGPTGVELAGAFVELFHVVLAKDYAGAGLGRARVVLVEMADHLLHGFSVTLPAARPPGAGVPGRRGPAGARRWRR